ncbi:MAG: hypothetical protein MUE63_10185 [Xanthomonadales bacterium]|nr:hypothetical protein [Xanthomonadales bacterium]
MYGTPGHNRRQLETLLHKIRERREDLQRQQRDLQALLRELEEAESNCRAALDGLEPPRTKRRL